MTMLVSGDQYGYSKLIELVEYIHYFIRQLGIQISCRLIRQKKPCRVVTARTVVILTSARP